MQIYTNECVFELHNLIKKLHKPLLHKKSLIICFFLLFIPQSTWGIAKMSLTKIREVG